MGSPEIEKVEVEAGIWTSQGITGQAIVLSGNTPAQDGWGVLLPFCVLFLPSLPSSLPFLLLQMALHGATLQAPVSTDYCHGVSGFLSNAQGESDRAARPSETSWSLLARFQL